MVTYTFLTLIPFLIFLNGCDFLCAATVTEDSFRNDCEGYVTFDSTPPTKTLLVGSEIQCGVACVQTQNCKMFVFHQKPNLTIAHDCEFFDSTFLPSYNEETTMCMTRNSCPNNKIEVGGVCVCKEGTYGDQCESRFKDCSDIFTSGLWSGPQNQVKYVWPDGYPEPFEVLCNLNAGGFTYLQQNKKLTTCDTLYVDDFFYRDWNSYKDGFGLLGDKECQFWLGLEKSHYLTSQANYELQVTLKAPGNAPGYSSVQGFYANTWIDSESNNYKLHMDGAFSNHPNPIGDSMLNPTDPSEALNGQMFSTYDRDNDNSMSNCAETFRAGFWFNDCTAANPNGWIRQPPDGSRDTTVPSILWKHDWGHRAVTSFYIRIRKI